MTTPTEAANLRSTSASSRSPPMTYVARTLTSSPLQMTMFLKNALSCKGLSWRFSPVTDPLRQAALGSGSPKNLAEWIKTQRTIRSQKMKLEETSASIGEFAHGASRIFRGVQSIRLRARRAQVGQHELDEHPICGFRPGNHPLLGDSEKPRSRRKGLRAQSQSYGSEARGQCCRRSFRRRLSHATSDQNDIIVAMLRRRTTATSMRLKGRAFRRQRPCAGDWQRRFLRHGLEGTCD